MAESFNTVLQKIKADIIFAFSVFTLYLDHKVSQHRFKENEYWRSLRCNTFTDIAMHGSITQNRPRTGRWRKGFVQWRKIAGCRDVHSLMDNRDSHIILTAHKQERRNTAATTSPSNNRIGNPNCLCSGLVVNQWKTNGMQVENYNHKHETHVQHMPRKSLPLLKNRTS